MFYYTGLPFHLARISYYVSVFEFVANNHLSGYYDRLKVHGMKKKLIFFQILFGFYMWFTLNLALKNIYIKMNIEQNQLTYNACSWISDIASDITMIKSFTIMNHSMRSNIFNEFVPLKLLSIADTRFALTTIML
ncbi:unnamed protein product [Musa textilis]